MDSVPLFVCIEMSGAAADNDMYSSHLPLDPCTAAAAAADSIGILHTGGRPLLLSTPLYILLTRLILIAQYRLLTVKFRLYEVAIIA
jgi:hypothetical protein